MSILKLNVQELLNGLSIKLNNKKMFMKRLTGIIESALETSFGCAIKITTSNFSYTLLAGEHFLRSGSVPHDGFRWTHKWWNSTAWKLVITHSGFQRIAEQYNSSSVSRYDYFFFSLLLFICGT